MNITHFIQYLNKTKGWHIDGSYYANIDAWKQWWEGYAPKFHDVKEQTADGSVIGRTMASLRMPKQACEDWASLLLNDKTTITVKDKDSAAWLLGNDDQTGGMLRDLHFWPKANELVEKAFRSGTGAFVLSVEGCEARGGMLQRTENARICLDYVPAECILPITVRHGVVLEAAFASEVYADGKACVYLQTHTLVPAQNGGKQYKITNEYFKSDSADAERADYVPAPLPKGLIASFTTGSDIPLFALFSPAIVKNLSGGAGLGMAVFADALDANRQVDLAFDNYSQDIFLGGKKVFYDGRLVQSVVDKNGVEHRIPPDAARRQIFYQLPPGPDPDAKKEWHEYNPDLRVEANSRAVQDALNYFSFKCGLGAHHYRFEPSGVKTATEYNGSQQELVQHANRHQINIESALIQIIRALLWAGKTFLGANVDPDTQITVHFDDAYITDTESRMANMKDDALNGLIPRYKYLMERYGYDEETAKSMVDAARQESQNAGPALGFGG